MSSARNCIASRSSKKRGCVLRSTKEGNRWAGIECARVRQYSEHGRRPQSNRRAGCGALKAWHCDGREVPLPEGHRFPMGKYALLRRRLLEERVFSPAEMLASDLVERELLL